MCMPVVVYLCISVVKIPTPQAAEFVVKSNEKKCIESNLQALLVVGTSQ